MTTKQIIDANNKAIEKKIIKNCKDLPIITKHFTTVNDEDFQEPILELTNSQSSEYKKLINQ